MNNTFDHNCLNACHARWSGLSELIHWELLNVLITENETPDHPAYGTIWIYKVFRREFLAPNLNVCDFLGMSYCFEFNRSLAVQLKNPKGVKGTHICPHLNLEGLHCDKR